MNRRHLTPVDLDNALAQLTPEMATAIRQCIPTAYADQLRAAHSESVTLIETAENKPGGTRYVPQSAVDDWLRLGLLDTLCRWGAGTAKTCLHMPDTHRPEPAWACAWKPGLVVCTACLRMLKAFGEDDKRCDRCGRVCAGTESDDAIYTTTVWLGGLAYQAGTCQDCLPHT